MTENQVDMIAGLPAVRRLAVIAMICIVALLASAAGIDGLLPNMWRRSSAFAKKPA